MESDFVDLELYTDNEISLHEVSNFLKGLKANGTSQNEVMDFLKGLRTNKIAEDKDERILEILDVVSGWCNERYRVW